MVFGQMSPEQMVPGLMGPEKMDSRQMGSGKLFTVQIEPGQKGRTNELLVSGKRYDKLNCLSHLVFKVITVKEYMSVCFLRFVIYAAIFVIQILLLIIFDRRNKAEA